MLPNITNVRLDVVKESGEFTIATIPYCTLSAVWGYVKQQLDKDPELWNKGQTYESLRYSIEIGDLQLWLVVKDGFIYMTFLTMFYEYPTQKNLQVVWGMGDQLEKFISVALSGLETFAYKNNCKQIEIIGRDGWKKPLLPFGYVKTQTTFVKDLVQERPN